MSETREFRFLLPQHMSEQAGDITVSGGWHTHDHPHAHTPDKQGAQHHPGFSHRHEHRWQPNEDHHHQIDQPGAGGR